MAGLVIGMGVVILVSRVISGFLGSLFGSKAI
jgi:hypothetical protein